ncbi:MAG: AAA family ATPase [Thermoleophilia bacterium]|nr:AAA family ATPase [Thermoleophilia bacterium]
MATADPTIDAGTPTTEQPASTELADQWRILTRAATIVAVLTSPALFVWFTQRNGWPVHWALLATAAVVICFRGLADLLFRRLIPSASLFGHDSMRLREEDVVARRRVWFWRFWLRIGITVSFVITTAWLLRGGSWLGTFGWFFSSIGTLLKEPQLWVQVVFVFFLFIANFLILLGPLLAMNLSQVRGFEPGDAEWGVRLADVRGQEEAKEEVRRVVTLWQSGEAFERAGGKRERGLLFLGAPGTGKTMLAKAIATGFNSPFVSIPGSGFAATFIGIDAIVVRFVARKAKKLARKWGGTCIVFIDEIDAVGMRRNALNPGLGGTSAELAPPPTFYGPRGALNPSGDLILDNAAWREWLFQQRETRAVVPSGLYARLLGVQNFMFPGGMGGMGMGSLALNQLLVVMDGIDNPPFLRRFTTSKLNTFLDASYVIPRRLGKALLRLPAPRPRKEQIYFIGATNVPIDRLDPALIRPGRMGRHVWFRTPTVEDRKDIFELYMGKVAHEPALDTPEKRHEIARITGGYSPAMIDQVCSMALTYAHHDGRREFEWGDLVEAITTIESGMAVNVDVVPFEDRSTAIHEAGHAAAAHVYAKNLESTRLSVRRRGSSGGHHQAREREERFFSFRSEEMARLIWGLGAMAAEYVFYGETTTGVGGDVQSATAQVAVMVGGAAMSPEPVDVTPLDDESPEQARQRVMKRFELIGAQIMNRVSGGSALTGDPVASALADPVKRQMAAELLGQAFFKAYNLMVANKGGVEKIADVMLERREMYGDEVVRLLESAELKVPTVDYNDEAAWPRM